MGGGFTAIMGDVGSGKTLFLTILTYEQYQLGRNIYHNHYLDFGEGPIKPIEPADLHNASNGVASLDEMWTWIESRAELNGRDVQTFLSHELFQSRKSDVDYIGTMQLLRSIDVRFREMVRWIIRPEKVSYGFRYKIYNNRDQLVQVRKLTFENAEKYYPFYQSYRKVEEIDNSLLWKVITDRTKLIPELDEIIADMRSKSTRKWTTPAIKGYCNENRYAPHYVPEIYNRIKYLETIGVIKYDP